MAITEWLITRTLPNRRSPPHDILASGSLPIRKCSGAASMRGRRQVMHIHSVANMAVRVRAQGAAPSGDPAPGHAVLRGRQSTRALKRKLLQGTCRTLVCGLAALAWSQQSLADDTTNAAMISDPIVWGQSMHQVMGGTSATLPGASAIRGPMGIYAIVQLADKITAAKS